jgi:hypothetical protein
MYVSGNAVATVGNIVSNAGLVRIGVVSLLLDGTFFVFTALVLYKLLQQVLKSMARIMLVFVILATSIKCLNAVFLFESLHIATDNSYATVFSIKGSNALKLIFSEFGKIIS